MRQIIFLFLVIINCGSTWAEKIPYDDPKTGSPKGLLWKKATIYFSWSYNWTLYSPTNVSFNLPQGSYTVYKVEAHDRPSPFKDYLDLLNWSTPQYNVTLGFKVPLSNNRTQIGLALEQDHMKWVADFSIGKRYGVSGNYIGEVYVKGVDGTQTKVDFDYVKTTGDFSYIAMYEHTNGYNFPHLTALVDQRLLGKAESRLKLLVNGGIGLGMMVPKTELNQYIDSMGVMVRQGIDNPFHVAGWGIGLHIGLAISYQPKHSRMGLELSTVQKFGYSKINNALLNGKGYGTASDSGVWWWQRLPVMLSINFGIIRAKSNG